MALMSKGASGRGMLLILALFLGFQLSSGTAAAQMSFQRSETIKHGRELAKINCGRCHAIGLEGESPHKEAPPFWTLFTRLPVNSIAAMLVKKSTPETSDMPHFTITRKQAKDIGIWIAWVQPLAHGKRLAEMNCARCHAVGSKDKSSHREAPPFRKLLKRYPIDALQEAFATGIETGHPDMPVFKMSQTQTADVLAYIEGLQQ